MAMNYFSFIKKQPKFRTKSAPDRPLFGRTDFLKFVWRAAVLLEATVDNFLLLIVAVVEVGIWASTDSMKNILHHDTKECCGTGVTGGFLKTAHTINGFLIQIFGPEIQAQN
jgi:hypothetical protein